MRAIYRYIISIFLFFTISASAFAAQPQEPLIAAEVSDHISMSIPSKASPDGVEIAIIFPKKPRYPDGAPVAVMVEPALSSAKPGIYDKSGLTALGFIVINFGYPGPAGFDKGGPISKRALADVLLFAMGDKYDAAGKTIDIISPVRVALGTTGAVGWSHGGNALITTLESYPQELGNLKYYVSYESPCGTSKETLGGSMLADYGRNSMDPDPGEDADGDGFRWNDGRNPYYSPGSGMDLSKISWDAQTDFKVHGKEASGRGVLFIDGNGNGRFDLAMSGRPLARSKDKAPHKRVRPKPTPDTNNDGRIGPGEDYPFAYLTYSISGKAKRVYSLEVTRASVRLFPMGFPETIANIEESSAFWGERDMAACFEKLGLSFQSMLACICSGREDHVQSAPDYPHIRAQYEGLKSAGLRWARINPENIYITDLIGDQTFEFPETKPNEESDLKDMWDMTTPTRGSLTRAVVSAAVAELADRAKAGRFDSPLGRALFPAGISVPAAVPDILWAPDRPAEQ